MGAVVEAFEIFQTGDGSSITRLRAVKTLDTGRNAVISDFFLGISRTLLDTFVIIGLEGKALFEIGSGMIECLSLTAIRFIDANPILVLEGLKSTRCKNHSFGRHVDCANSYHKQRRRTNIIAFLALAGFPSYVFAGPAVGAILRIASAQALIIANILRPIIIGIARVRLSRSRSRTRNSDALTILFRPAKKHATVFTFRTH